MDLLEERGAHFSPCRRWRYRLWIEWNQDRPVMLWLLLNPSTADEIANDPTVERCQRRAHASGFGSVGIANIFAWRSTDPAGLLATEDPVGPENDAAIIDMATRADLIVCGWGKHGSLLGRGPAVEEMLRSRRAIRHKLHALKLNADGSPRHPLYVGYEAKPVAWRKEAEFSVGT